MAWIAWAFCRDCCMLLDGATAARHCADTRGALARPGMHGHQHVAAVVAMAADGSVESFIQAFGP
eukprot:6259221-Prorocentrum_lima.AAC.1